MNLYSFNTYIKAMFMLFALPVLSFANHDSNISWQSFPADISYGVVGNASLGLDDPSDNIFKIQLDTPLLGNEEVNLVYELKGVSNHAGVARSINGQYAIGGYFVKTSDVWTKQEEKINPALLKQGENIIQFSLPGNAPYSYEIRALSLKIGKHAEPSTSQKLVVNQPNLNYYGNQAYFKGFVTEGARVYVDDREIPTFNGEFEYVISNQNFLTGWDVVVRAEFRDGSRLSRYVEFCDDAGILDVQFQLEEKNTFEFKTFHFDELERLSTTYCYLETDCGAYSEELSLLIAPLRSIDVPAVNLDIINVTAGNIAFRVTPTNIQFEQSVQVGVKYDLNKIPNGYSPEDIRTFLFDQKSKRWIELEKTKIDKENQFLISSSGQTGDMINGIIQVPESPESTAFTPTQMKDIQAANPSAGINEIQPPIANNMGTANLTYPLIIPPGRRGMQPQLALTYNSDGGATWCGTGWDLSIPAISIDTRWGVPRYHSNLETETYSFNGQQLFPVAHRGEEYLPREEEKRFYPRVEGAFNKIIRHGDNPKNYWWEVTDKSGTRYFYGGLPGIGVVETSVLRDDLGNIGYWAIREMRDLHDNFVSYHGVIVEDYGTKSIRQIISANIDGLLGRQVYFESITYTGHQQEEGAYTIKFIRDGQGDGQIARTNANRPDIIIDARLGFKRVTADLLEKIEVKYQGNNIRSYELKYKIGAFSKTLLDTIIEYDSEGLEFTRHAFNYYNDVVDNAGSFEPMENQQQSWDVTSDPVGGGLINPLANFNAKVTALSGVRSNNFGFGAAFTVGAIGNPSDKSLTAGGNYSYSRSTSKGILTFIDIDGDALPDKVYVNENGGVEYKKNLSGPDGEEKYADTGAVIEGLENIYQEKSSSNSVGLEVNAGVAGVAGNANVGYSRTTSNTTLYFADVNGDRLVDVVRNGRVLYNHIDETTSLPVFTSNSGDTPSPIQGSGELDPNILNPDTLAIEIREAIENNPLHDVVKVWRAPFDGKISIVGDIELVEFNSPEWQDYELADGVIVSIQKGDTELWRDSLFNISQLSLPQDVDWDSMYISKGEQLYFRVQSRLDGNFDQIIWDPTITYYEENTNVVDPNNNKVYQFNTKKDYLTSGKANIVLPIDGMVEVKGFFKKPPLTDDIRLEVFKNNDPTPIWTNTYTANADILIDELVINTISDVLEEEELYFRVSSYTNVDWNAIEWYPVISYLSSNDPNNPLNNNPDGSPIFQIFPIVDYDVFADMKERTLPWETQSSVGPSPLVTAYISPDTLVDNTPGSDLDLNGKITFSIKRQGQLVKRYSVNVIDGIFQNNNNWITDALPPGEYYFEFHADNPDLYTAINDYGARVFEFPNTTIESAGFYTKLTEEEELFGSLHRYWGQFAYNGNHPYRNLPIDQSVLVVDEDDELNLITTRFHIMSPSTYENRWYGADDKAYFAQDTISSSRLGEDDLSFFDLFAAGVDRRAINKKTVSNSTFAYAGISPFGVNNGDGWSKVVTDFMDMNGDSYPDNIGDAKIQYTTGQGVLSSIDNPPGFENVQTSTSNNTTLSAGGVVASFKMGTSNGGNKSVKAKGGQDADGRATGGVPANAAFSFSTDKTGKTLMDINGDGLPDRIASDGRVNLNLGYRFADEDEDWGFTSIRDAQTEGYSGGLGINLMNNSFSAGIGLARNDNATDKSLQDVNGDGLPDIISVGGNGLSVQINLGNGFSGNAINWDGIEKINQGSSTSESVNGAFTIPIIIPIIGLKICINPSGNAGQNINKQNANIQDINGDGFPDYLESDNTGNLSVRTSKINKTNKLKQVHRPLGAHFTLDYTRIGNNYDLPNSVWTMSELTMYDGFDGDGADTQKNTFVYENGYYDRHEREFYGFGRVVTHDLDTENNDALYRSNTQVFLNKNYYEKGLPERESVQDADGNYFTINSYNYDLKDVISGASLPPAFVGSDNGAAFPATIEMKTEYYEKLATVQKVSKMTYEYDQYGNISYYYDSGDLDNNEVDINPNDDYNSTITYHEYPATYIVGSPSSIVVEANGTTYRKRETDINGSNGELLQIRSFLEDGSVAKVDLDYDQYGNIRLVERPENHNGQRFSYEYGYDSEVHTYVEQITDSYEYTSEAEYDYRYGVMTLSRDINAQEVHTSLDNRGRIETITGPYELANPDADYTIKFEYHENADVPWALTQHFDEQHPDNPIETVTFIDGLSRPLQVKKDVAIFTSAGGADVEQRSVSGRIVFDAFGRTVSQRYPVLEDLAIDKGLFNNEVDVIAPTTTTYDEIDRTLLTTLPDGATTSMHYTIGQDRQGQDMLLTRITDAEDNIKEHFTNVRGLKTAVKEYIADFSVPFIWTSFEYSPVNENVSILDHEENRINYEYDWFGRTTVYDHPDGGITNYTYDLASNLTEKLTANLAVAGSSAIVYNYDHERLSTIVYPENSKNNVAYIYGDTISEDNQVGRVAVQLDATGKQCFSYGLHGEIVKTVRHIIVIEGRPPRIYTSRWRYDSWNRLQQMVYPDGELVNYTYNEGGNLNSFMGTKLGLEYPYLNQLGYDKFEQRVYLKHGNNTESTYTYEPERRRLQNMLSTTATNRPMMNNTYTYDRVSNVLNISNTAPIPPVFQMGGPCEMSFTYDDLYRLKTAEGTWQSSLQTHRYELEMSYNTLHDITNKFQHHQRQFYYQTNWQTSNFTSYSNAYDYDSAKPHAATHIGNRSYEYDPNGNMISKVDDNFFGQRRFLQWDEENRLMQIDDDERIHNYIYDADNIRVVKQKDAGQTIWINGVPVGGNNSNNYTVFVNPYMVVRGGGFTKHYYIEGQRICSKLGLGPFGLASTWEDYNYWDAWGDWNDFYAWGNFDNFANNDAWNNWDGINDGSIWDNWDPTQGGDLPNGDWINIMEFFSYYYHPDHLGNSSYITNRDGEVHQHFEYFPFGEAFVYEHQNTDQSPYRFNGKFFDEETGLYDYGARYYDPQESRWLSVDPLADHPNQMNISPYAYAWNNPVVVTDPDGRCPNCITGLIGAGVGVLVGGGIEVASQLYNNGSITDWGAVGGSALQGGITGGAAGFTGGTSLAVTAGVSGTANAVGGIANRAIQGKETTASDLVIDASLGAGLGAGGKVVGNAVKGVADDLSNAAKGKLGEAITKMKYNARGYVSQGKSVVETGKRTATGRVQVAKYDHSLRNPITGKQLTVESKFNTSGLTKNQRAAAGNVTTPGKLIIDRTTSQGLGNTSGAAAVGAGAGAAAQRNKD